MSSIPERARTVLGVKGRYHGATVGGSGYRPGTWTQQRWGASRSIDWYGEPHTMRVEMRFDDGCRNGHNTFAITAEIRRPRKRDIEAGGCLHNEIREHFPELAPLIRWHLVSADGPMHYEANTLYHAGNADHNGLRAREPSRFSDVVTFGTSPVEHRISKAFSAWLQDPDVSIRDLEVLRIDHPRERETFGPKFTFGGWRDEWHRCPFNSEAESLQWLEALQGPHQFARRAMAWSDGKERDLDAARRTACWPEATDKELSAPTEDLRAMLRERLPGLLADFRADMESCGFAWAPENSEPQGVTPE